MNIASKRDLIICENVSRHCFDLKNSYLLFQGVCMLSFANILRDMSNTSKFRQSHLWGPSDKHAMKHCARMRIQVYLQAQAEIQAQVQNERSALTRVIITFMIDMVIVIIAWQEWREGRRRWSRRRRCRSTRRGRAGAWRRTTPAVASLASWDEINEMKELVHHKE